MSFISYEKSLEILKNLNIKSGYSERVPLSLSNGRVLSKDIVAKYNDPQFQTASMDGYAVIHSDLDNEFIKILGVNPAGHNETRSIKKGECIKTFTGSKMPKGADTLIQIENVKADTKKIIINEKVSLGSSVRKIGEGYSKRDILIKKGTKIGFVEIGVMAGLNCVMIDVFIKPKVAVISTGSEILDLGEDSSNSSQIRSSNNYTLASLFENAGAEVLQLGTVKDDENSIKELFINALESCDILVSTGGVSVGDYDFVKDIIPSFGAEILFKGVGIKPGRHILLARQNKKFIVALPGFSYSSTVTAILYVLPILQKMMNKQRPYKMIKASLGENFEKRSKFTEFSACNITNIDDKYEVNFKNKKVGSSAILTNMLNASVLMISKEEDKILRKGSLVDVILLENF